MSIAEAARTGGTVSPSVEKLVELTELRYRIPGTEFRFGLDAVIGLVPGIGDFLGMLLGLAVVLEGVRRGVPRAVLLRMLFNIWLDGAVGSIPLVGDLWDFWFKANRRNLRLLQKYV